jgi:hypothetical protein
MDEGVTAANQVSESAADGTDRRAAPKGRRSMPERPATSAHKSHSAARSLHTILVALALVCVVADAGGQRDTEPDLKAGFLFNFMKFVEWPADALPPDRPIQACIVGSPKVADALARGVQGRVANGHSITVSNTSREDPLRSCHLVYVEGIDERETARVVAKAAGLPVFTVSDYERFAVRGGVANFYVAKDRLRFAVNVDAARRARLQISSKMLAIAMLVTEEK